MLHPCSEAFVPRFIFICFWALCFRLATVASIIFCVPRGCRAHPVLVAYGSTAKACLLMLLGSLLLVCRNKFNDILYSAYLLLYGSTAKVCFLLLWALCFQLVNLFCAGYRLRIICASFPLLLSDSIAKVCLYLLPGSLVPILASNGFDDRFADPQEGSETNQKSIRSQGHFTFPNLPPHTELSFSFLCIFAFFFFPSEK